VASASVDKSLKIWSLSFRKEAENDQNVFPFSICILNNGLIAIGSFQSIKILLKESSLKLVAELLKHNDPVRALVVLKNNSLVSGSDDTTIKIWNQNKDYSFECVNSFVIQGCKINSLAVFESDLLISGGSDGSVYIWNQTTLNELQQIKLFSSIIYSIIVLDNGNLAVGHDSPIISILKKISKTMFDKSSDKLKGHTACVWSLAVLPNKMFASASWDKSIRIWSQITLKCIRIINDHTDLVMGLAEIKRGYFVSISKDKTAIVWDSYSFKKIDTFKTTAPGSYFYVSSYLENSFIIGDADGKIQLWSESHLKNIKNISENTETITGLAVLDNGFLVGASFNGKITVWDNSFNSTVKESHSEAILALKVFENDSLISCSLNGTCKIWHTALYTLNSTIYKE
jgi:F-box/WD-40 domain protein 7